MVKIYTRTGDTGETSLLGGRRVRKDDVRIGAIGDVDETNAVIGVVRVELLRSGVAPSGIDGVLAQIQHRLFDVGAELASVAATSSSLSTIGDADVLALEAAIDHWDTTLPPLSAFILPGGGVAAAQLHLARCVSRRAERSLVHLGGIEPVRSELIRYVNRLSDLLFVLARAANQANRISDTVWEPKAGDASDAL